MREGWIWADLPAGSARALTTTRDGGFSTGAYAEFNLAGHVGDVSAAVAGNRRLLMDALAVSRIQWLNQVHGTRCVHADATTVLTAPAADAAWTELPDLALAVLTADCLPVVFAHRSDAAVAVAHAGWRGLVAGVLTETLRALPGDPTSYSAWVGPGIGVTAYEVGDEVAAAVRDMADAGPDCDRCLRRGDRAGKYQLDLAGLAATQLAHLGVPMVADAGLCAFSDRRFYSFRREPVTGRMATLVWLPG